jgi:hypothetical protein
MTKPRIDHLLELQNELIALHEAGWRDPAIGASTHRSRG